MGLFTHFEMWWLKRRYQKEDALVGRGGALRAVLASAPPKTPEGMKAAYNAACEAVPVVTFPRTPAPSAPGFLRVVGGERDGQGE